MKKPLRGFDGNPEEDFIFVFLLFLVLLPAFWCMFLIYLRSHTQ